VVRYIPKMVEYNLKIVHRPGKTNKADPLSQRPGCDQGENDHEDVLVLPPELFVRLFTEEQSLEQEVERTQERHQQQLEEWTKTEGVQKRQNCFGTKWYHHERLAVPEDPTVQWSILQMYHNHKIAGHPGILRTWSMVAKDYWWPTMRTFITRYVQGYATCQSTKSGTTRPKVPLVPIPPRQNYVPYSMVALDLITDLPESQGYDSILMITDHDCSKAAFFIPCNKTIDSEGIARCYAKEVFPYYGPPKRVILDRDPHFASKWTRVLCKQLGIDQNISTAYHPQTDGQSE
jgi:Integrase zinc binding domain